MPYCIRHLGQHCYSNGVAPNKCQAIPWTNADLLSINPSGINFSEIWIKIQQFSFSKMYLKMLSAKFWLFCSVNPFSSAGQIQWGDGASHRHRSSEGACLRYHLSQEGGHCWVWPLQSLQQREVDDGAPSQSLGWHWVEGSIQWWVGSGEHSLLYELIYNCFLGHPSCANSSWDTIMPHDPYLMQIVHITADDGLAPAVAKPSSAMI